MVLMKKQPNGPVAPRLVEDAQLKKAPGWMIEDFCGQTGVITMDEVYQSFEPTRDEVTTVTKELAKPGVFFQSQKKV